ncbi:MAG: serine hydrolase [Gammaproteobacteria bacterium]|nr:serine hydrolase [Gammaproteobacteria bacterium]
MFSRFKLIITLVILLISNQLFSEDEKAEERSPAKNIEELKAQLEDIIEYHAIPGLSVAIVDKETDRLVAGFGLANKEQNIAASAETQFRIGSISKMFVGLAALKLIEEGELDLDTHLRMMVPELEFTNPWESTHPVKLIHLLQHTAGWDDIHLPEYANNDPKPLTLKQGLDFHPHSRVSRWRPGERMSYSNAGPAVMAYVIQKKTNMDFERYIEKNFLQPLNMMSTTYRYPSDDTLMATLYVEQQPVDYWHIMMRPSGSINSTARDMANLVKFFLNRGEFNGERVLPERLMRHMERPLTTLAVRAGLKTGYGITNYSTPYKNFWFHGHNGGVNGGAAELAYNADQGFGYAFMINTNGGEGMREISKAIKDYLTYGVSGPKLPNEHELSADIAKEYSGYYMPVNPRQEFSRFIEQVMGVRELTLNEKGGRFSDSAEDISYVPTSDRLLRQNKQSKASLALLKDEQGLAIQVNGQYLQKISAFRHYLGQALFFTFIGLIVLHLIWFWVWLVRWLIGKIQKGPAMQVRVWPFIASLSVVVFVVTFAIAQVVDLMNLLGKISAASFIIMVATYIFAISAFGGLLQSVRYFNRDINAYSKWFCLFSSIIYSVVTCYLLYFGIIGFQTFG